MRLMAVATGTALLCLALGACGGGAKDGAGNAASSNASNASSDGGNQMAAQAPAAFTEEGNAISGGVVQVGNDWYVADTGDGKRRRLTTTPMHASSTPRYLDLSRFSGKRVRFSYQTMDDNVFWGVDEGSIRPYQSASGKADPRDPQRFGFVQDGDTVPRRLTEQLEPVPQHEGREHDAIRLPEGNRQITFDYLQSDSGWYYGVDPKRIKVAQQ